jgi:cysteine synthase A
MKIMRSFGAEVRLITPSDVENLKEESVPGAEIELPGRTACLHLERTESRIWWARQFSNPQNVEAHHDTAHEIVSQMNERIDAFTASIGTGGTLLGVAQILRKESPSIRIVGIQPASSRIKMTPGMSYPRSDIEGGIVSDMLGDSSLINEIVAVSDNQAVNMTHRLWREEGLFAGISSGANVLVALEQARKLGKGANVVTVLPDSGDRYLTTEHYVT